MKVSDIGQELHGKNVSCLLIINRTLLLSRIAMEPAKRI